MGGPPGPRVHDRRTWFPPSGAEPHGLAGRTRVVTSNGMVPLDHCAHGSAVCVLDELGRWTSGLVERFAPQPIWELTLERTRVRHTIGATAGQRWPITMPQRRLRGLPPLPFRTEGLLDVAGSPHWKLVTVNPSAQVRPDADGVLHGIVFGDGTRHRQPEGSRRVPYCQVYLCNDPAGCDSRQLAPLFEARGYRPVVRQDKQQVRFHGLPEHWKALPSDSSPAEYLRGFVAGWFAADGHVDARAPVAILASGQRTHLEWLQQIAPRAGLAVSTHIGLRRSASTFGPCEWHSLGLSASTLDAEFFVLPEKLARYRPAQFLKQWKVVSVGPSDSVEPVYSITVPNRGQYVIEGNILVCG